MRKNIKLYKYHRRKRQESLKRWNRVWKSIRCWWNKNWKRGNSLKIRK